MRGNREEKQALDRQTAYLTFLPPMDEGFHTGYHTAPGIVSDHNRRPREWLESLARYLQTPGVDVSYSIPDVLSAEQQLRRLAQRSGLPALAAKADAVDARREKQGNGAVGKPLRRAQGARRGQLDDKVGAAHDGRQLLDALGRQRLAVGSGDLQQHLRLVERHHRHVRAGQDQHQADARVLHRSRTHRLQREGAAHERERQREREALLAACGDDPGAHALAQLIARGVVERDGLPFAGERHVARDQLAAQSVEKPLARGNGCAARGDHVALRDGMPRRLGDLVDQRRQRGDDHRRHAHGSQAGRRLAHALVQARDDDGGVVSGKRNAQRVVEHAVRDARMGRLRLEGALHRPQRVGRAGAVDVERDRDGRARRLVDVGRLIEDRFDING